MEWALILVPVGAAAFWAAVSFMPVPGPQKLPDGPGPKMVDLAQLSMRIELEMSAIENTLRGRQLHYEAEGARQMRDKVKEILQQHGAR